MAVVVPVVVPVLACESRQKISIGFAEMFMKIASQFVVDKNVPCSVGQARG